MSYNYRLNFEASVTSRDFVSEISSSDCHVRLLALIGPHTRQRLPTATAICSQIAVVVGCLPTRTATKFYGELFHVLFDRENFICINTLIRKHTNIRAYVTYLVFSAHTQPHHNRDFKLRPQNIRKF